MHALIHDAWRRYRQYLPAFLDRGRHARAILERAEALARAEPPDPWLMRRREEKRPLLSLVAPIYNTPLAYLEALLASFRAQNDPERTSGLFELVLSDDGSSNAATRAWLLRHQNEPFLRLVLNPANAGIASATNAGIDAASGEWIGLIDHDDAIAPFALERIARALGEGGALQFLYTDEVITDHRLEPVGYFLKPAWDEVLLSGVNYINHFSVYRRERLIEIGKLRLGFEGSQDYDLLLRFTHGLANAAIRYLPYPAYLWRRYGASFSAKFLDKATQNARRALGERFMRGGKAMPVIGALDPALHRLDLAAMRDDWPFVSVMIPSKNARALISQVMEGLARRTDYPAFEVIVIDNGSDDPEVLALYETWRQGSIPFQAVITPEPFNFARAINRGAALARGEALLLLNNDIEIRDSGWLREMVACLDFPDTGIVGAKLLYPNETIQHVGVIAGLGGLAGHWFIGERRDAPGPMGRLRVRQSLSVVTGACFLISRACWQAIGPFDADRFAIAYNDVDFCLRAVEGGFRVVWTPFAELIHHESASRGSDETPENIARFQREQQNLRERHGTEHYQDPAFNPWWTRGYSNPRFAQIAALPKPR